MDTEKFLTKLKKYYHPKPKPILYLTIAVAIFFGVLSLISIRGFILSSPSVHFWLLIIELVFTIIPIKFLTVPRNHSSYKIFPKIIIFEFIVTIILLLALLWIIANTIPR